MRLVLFVWKFSAGGGLSSSAGKEVRFAMVSANARSVAGLSEQGESWGSQRKQLQILKEGRDCEFDAQIKVLVKKKKKSYFIVGAIHIIFNCQLPKKESPLFVMKMLRIQCLSPINYYIYLLGAVP